MDEPDGNESVCQAYGDLLRFVYGNDRRGWKLVGWGYADVVVEEVPSFRRFYLYGWAHQRVYTHGTQAYSMFPWPVAFSRLTPWMPMLEPLIFSPEVFADKMNWLKWIQERHKDLGMPADGTTNTRTI